MKGLIQRVSQAQVVVGGQCVGAIDGGLALLLAVEQGDSSLQADRLLHKILHYRVFADAGGKMNLSLKDTGGGLLIVSQFTLAADTKKGLRPSFSSAAHPALAQQLYDYFVMQAQRLHPVVATGIFAADMQVSLTNDGPVTFMLQDSSSAA